MQVYNTIEEVVTSVAHFHQKPWRDVVQYPMTIYILSEFMPRLEVGVHTGLEKSQVDDKIKQYLSSYGRIDYFKNFATGVITNINNQVTIKHLKTI